MLLVAPSIAAMPLPASAITISGTYYEDTQSTGCNSDPNCAVDFAQFPSTLTGMFVTITEVSCDYYSDQPLTEVFLGVTDAGAGFRRPHHITVPGNAGNWTFGAKMTFKITGGPPRAPRLRLVSASGIINAGCTIVGTISNQ